MAPDAFGSATDAIARAHTMLVSWESCQVARIAMPPSTGLGLKKWVVSCCRYTSLFLGVKWELPATLRESRRFDRTYR
jgi:hypothetical protein